MRSVDDSVFLNCFCNVALIWGGVFIFLYIADILVVENYVVLELLITLFITFFAKVFLYKKVFYFCTVIKANK